LCFGSTIDFTKEKSLCDLLASIKRWIFSPALKATGGFEPVQGRVTNTKKRGRRKTLEVRTGIEGTTFTFKDVGVFIFVHPNSFQIII
jgi:hypothetical protein